MTGAVHEAFDASGRQIWAHDGRGRTVFAYDAAGRLAAAVYPGGAWLGLAYDHAGRLVRRHSPGGAERLTYDEAGGLRSIAHRDGATSTYEYDDAGRIQVARAPASLSRYAYDEAGRVIAREQTVSSAPTAPCRLEARYDAAGRLIALHVPGFAPWLRYGYDDQGRLLTLGHDGAPDLIRIEHEAGGRRVVVRFANSMAQVFELDDRGQIRRIQVTSREAEPLLDLRYRVDATGQVTAVNEQRFVYDRDGRLIEHGPLLGSRSTYRYDGAGNRLEALAADGTRFTYCYEAAGRLAHWDSGGRAVACCYDADGNLAERRDEGGCWTYRYDGRGRLTAAWRNGRIAAEYAYDHAGWCVFKRTDTGTVVIHRDPWGCRVAESHSDGETRVYLGPPGRPLACLVVRDGAVETFFWHSDHLGSVRAVTDVCGRLVARQDFDPFGNAVAQAEAPRGSPGPRVFAGHPFDGDLGLYECGARWYDPEIGRFVSPDPYTFSADDPRLLGMPPGPEGERWRAHQLRLWRALPARRNRYVYALNSPLSCLDPDGRSAGRYFLYTVASIIWAVPYTLVGFLFFEVVLNWVTFAWLWDMGDHEWRGESSDRLGAWAWWTIGGLSGRLVIGGGGFTLGNFVISNADFMRGLDTTTRNFGIPERHAELVAPVDTSKLLTERAAVVEHELRHTNQFGWWGPFMMPWVLVMYFLFQNLVQTGFSKLLKREVHVEWSKLWDLLTEKWWNRALAGVGILLLPGAYFWDFIVRGGRADSWFEQDAGQSSGAANGLNVRAAASQDEVAPGGTATISVIFDATPTPPATATLTTTGSGAPTLSDVTPPEITNLRVFSYTAGANTGTDVITAAGGGSTFTLSIEVR